MIFNPEKAREKEVLICAVLTNLNQAREIGQTASTFLDLMVQTQHLNQYPILGKSLPQNNKEKETGLYQQRKGDITMLLLISINITKSIYITQLANNMPPSNLILTLLA